MCAACALVCVRACECHGHVLCRRVRGRTPLVVDSRYACQEAKEVLRAPSQFGSAGEATPLPEAKYEKLKKGQAGQKANASPFLTRFALKRTRSQEVDDDDSKAKASSSNKAAKASLKAKAKVRKA